MSDHQRFAIAIDGPAAAGKSSVAKRVADALDAVEFDTGLLYRAVTLLALRDGVSFSDEKALAEIAGSLDLVVGTPTVEDGRRQDVWLDGRDVTWDLRSPEVDRHLSVVSAYPKVRAALLAPQRRAGQRGRVVMVGRDIGTVILPDAELKIYLDASPEERARRRYQELAERGQEVSYNHVLSDLLRRDQLDSQRTTAPLRPAPDALVLQTEGLTLDQVVERIVFEARQRLDNQMAAAR
jgi:cytidylate kinase